MPFAVLLRDDAPLSPRHYDAVEMHLSVRSVGPPVLARLRNQRGTMMVEALIAVSVFTLLGAAVLSGSTAARNASASAEHAAVAENIARNQLETILAAPYQDPPHSYAPISTPPGYAVTADAQELVVSDPNIATIVVTVTLKGEPVLTLGSIRTKAP